MQNETHYTSTVKGTNGVKQVFRKAGNVKVGTITPKHRGYEAAYAGVRTIHSTKAEAFAALAK